MKIILKENIENLGKRGDIVDVAAGYARNYLVPRKLAIEVAPGNIKMIEMEQKSLKKKLAQETISYQNVIDRIDQTSLSFERKAGEKDVIFGSVSVTDIKEALDKLGFEIEEKKILLEEPIKRLGNYAIPIKVFHEKQADLKVEVKKEGEEETQRKAIETEEKKETKEEEIGQEKEESLMEDQPERDEEEKKEEKGEESSEESKAKKDKAETE
jgi:large subunit ribosomal protein L9